jgi:hypothetical protein
MQLFDPTPEALAALQSLVAQIPQIQARLKDRHPALHGNDRVAHQQQVAGSSVELRVAAQLPATVRGIGPFEPGRVHFGVGRISNGLGCPHLETDPDFLGIMLAFHCNGRRIDFLGINDPTSPTDTVQEFIVLLAATAEAAGVAIPFGSAGELDIGNLTAGQVAMFATLREHLGLKRATAIYAHVAKQTARTLLSASAYQQYWTGVVRTGAELGKFTLIPTDAPSGHRGLKPGERHLSDDWRERQRTADLRFELHWIPFVDERATPLGELTEAWDERERVSVGQVIFPRVDPDSRGAKLFAILAAEMGANPGNWAQDLESHAHEVEIPATEFTAGRLFAYQASQRGRQALAEQAYESVFASGEISPELAAELVRRYRAKRTAGHAQPDLGTVPDS